MSSLQKTTNGLDPPAGLFDGFMETLKGEAVKLYKRQVESAARGTCKQEEHARKQTQDQTDALEKAAALDPHQALGMAFTAFLKKKPVDPKTPTVDYLKMMDLKVNSPTLIDTKSPQPKNGSSPGAALGPNQNKNFTGTKGSGKGSTPSKKMPKKKNGKGSSRGAAASGSAQQPKGGQGKGRGKGKGQSKGKGAGSNPGQNPKAGKSGNPKGSGRGGQGAGKNGQPRSRQ